MIQRATNPRRPHAQRYNQLGVAEAFKGGEGFVAFYLEVGPRPSPKHSIDRIDNSKGYIPGNVRWATPQEQRRNQFGALVELNGVVKTRGEWAAHFGVARDTVRNRLRAGWSMERAITTPPTPNGAQRQLGLKRIK